jgi:hypothetical protein
MPAMHLVHGKIRREAEAVRQCWKASCVRSPYPTDTVKFAATGTYADAAIGAIRADAHWNQALKPIMTSGYARLNVIADMSWARSV